MVNYLEIDLAEADSIEVSTSTILADLTSFQNMRMVERDEEGQYTLTQLE